MEANEPSQNRIKRFVIAVVERYFPFNMRTLKTLFVIVTPLLLGAVLVLGWTSSKKVKELVTRDFNQQQLLLAQHAARQIENNLGTLKKELALLSFSPSLQYSEKVSIGNRMRITFSSIRDIGALEIRYVESSRSITHLVDDSGYHTGHSRPEDISHLKWGGKEENKGNLSHSDISRVINGGIRQKLVMKFMLPVWQESVDETHPVATGRYSGVLMFVVDVTALIEKTTRDIRSGKTGYAWVIDENGIFLSHPEKEFIGKSAFEARKEKKPTISFDRINAIQTELMLTGKEGTSWYISGWHRGKEGEMKKLIAYTPIHIGEPGKQFWSTAVVAPISEVEGAIHDIQIRQFILEGVVVLAILFGGFLVMGMMLRWSSSLREEVGNKTKELSKSENRCRSLIENANDIIFTVDQDGNISSINQAGCSFFNRGKEEIVGINIGEICFNEDSAFTQFMAINEVIRTRLNKQITCPVNIQGGEYWLSINFSGLLDEKGEVFAIMGIARDITERKKIEAQMYYTEKLASLGTMAAGVAHEINNPLAIILGFTDLLKEKVPPDSEFHEVLKTIEKQGTNAKHVVENLLTFARVTEHREENVDINKNIEEVLGVAGNTLSMNKITLRKELAGDLPAITGDPRELQQVFLNIINNAVSVMKGGGILTISTRTADGGGKAEIRISDTGCGIRKEHRTRIFDPLFTTKKVGEGTGLGLSVSYGIIARHGGNITFKTATEEEAGDTGTTFVVTLPVSMQA
jgi:two-component system NtrC family sensor kinase